MNVWRDATMLVHDGEPKWTERARLASRFIDPGSRVLDLGCGLMALRRFLPDNCSYVPSDFVPRGPETEVADLNAGEFPDGEFDVITMMGVLEYLSAPECVLREARRHAPRLLLSYHHTRWRSPLGKRREFRRTARRNYLSVPALARCIARTGWKISAKLAFDLSVKRTDHFILMLSA